jgi:Fur family transcriptional regulator, ferric uptake regulator
MSRRTGQRRAIVSALREADAALTAQELHRRVEGVGLATVYRNLQRLAEEGHAEAVRRDTGEQAFLLCGGGHHHHLTCRVCGRVEPVRDCGLDGWAREVASRHGFRDVEHRAELVGVCLVCREASPPRRRTRLGSGPGRPVG